MERKDNKDYFDFTARANKQIFKALSEPMFEVDGAEGIFRMLEKEMENVSFADYLKRYIYKKVDFGKAFEEVAIEEYQKVIIESFAENNTPKSFVPTSTKMSAMVKNWLTQRQVKRIVIFLLGFGLKMSIIDVNEFLEKGIKEKGIYAKNPFEAICWYCYKFGYSFSKYEELMERYEQNQDKEVNYTLLFGERTINMRNKLSSVNSDAELIEYLKWLRSGKSSSQSVTARSWFDKLYEESRKLVAAYLNASEVVEEIRSSGKMGNKYYAAEDITAGDIEKVIYSAVPLDKNGNMVPEKESLLSEQIGGNRFSRQRVNEILNGRTEITRTDLITLYFFVLAKKMEDDFGEINEKAVYFQKSMNKILEDCSMWPLYTASPYESFIYLCMKTEDPLDTYAQVLEYAYTK